jgi:hypothetical protein
MTRLCLALSFLLLAIGSASAQTAVPTTTTQTAVAPHGYVSRTIYPQYQYKGAVVSGSPFSWEQFSENIQTLADGTHITSKRIVSYMWRDSQGRTRTERPLIVDQNDPREVQITDPIDGVSYVLDPQQRIAYRFQRVDPRAAIAEQSAPNAAMNAPVPVRATPVPDSPERPRPEMSRESLGTQVMEGVMVEGMRTTEIYPVGAVGNDRTFSVVCENWLVSA